jgi:hypothetical protein
VIEVVHAGRGLLEDLAASVTEKFMQAYLDLEAKKKRSAKEFVRFDS